MTNIKEIKIVTEYIELQQLLKKVDLIASGGEAKFFLSTNTVLVDGVRETRRGRKLYPDSKVEVLNQTYLVNK